MYQALQRSLPAWGAWVEIIVEGAAYSAPESLPAWGAWVEILPQQSDEWDEYRRSPHGERGLKSDMFADGLTPDGRSPHGERGLKYQFTDIVIKIPRRSPHGERGLKYALEGKTIGFA